MAGCKTDLVIHHNVYSSFRGKAARAGHIECFHHHTLPCKSGITMDDHWHHLAAQLVTIALLTCTYRTMYHGRNNFQVRGIECQRQVNQPARCPDI